MTGDMAIRPVDFARHAQHCLRYIEESFIASFGDARRFLGEDGQGRHRYLDWLAQLLEADPMGAVHLWHGDDIVGQSEMKVITHDPAAGHVMLFYVVPSLRGSGAANLLENYAREYFVGKGCRCMRLNVSVTNLRAQRFYAKNGWVDKGPLAKDAQMHLMEKSLT